MDRTERPAKINPPTNMVKDKDINKNIPPPNAPSLLIHIPPKKMHKPLVTHIHRAIKYCPRNLNTVMLLTMRSLLMYIMTTACLPWQCIDLAERNPFIATGSIALPIIPINQAHAQVVHAAHAQLLVLSGLKSGAGMPGEVGEKSRVLCINALANTQHLLPRL